MIDSNHDGLVKRRKFIAGVTTFYEVVNHEEVVFALDIGVYKTGVYGQVLAGTTAGWARLTCGVIGFDFVRQCPSGNEEFSFCQETEGL